MKEQENRAAALTLMNDFARSTGIYGETENRRYLWTDAFAVCTFLGLSIPAETEDRCRNAALKLVDLVHHTLGRFRDDDRRTGWISGLDEQDGERRPAAGGLRIGKPLPERGPADPFDEELEWERDGQYFHYLTKWMHALAVAFRITGDIRYLRWSIDLARTAHSRFVYVPAHDNKKLMYWKMNVDLSRPAVASMGHHDPLDALITYLELDSLVKTSGADTAEMKLDNEIADAEKICAGRDWITPDPLGIGGLLFDAFRLAGIGLKNGVSRTGMLEELLYAGGKGLGMYAAGHPERHPAEYRLAFRELGLAIGLHAVDGIEAMKHALPLNAPGAVRIGQLIAEIKGYASFGSGIEKYWMNPVSQRSSSWVEHRDINTVTLAAALAPDGFLSV